MTSAMAGDASTGMEMAGSPPARHSPSAGTSLCSQLRPHPARRRHRPHQRRGSVHRPRCHRSHSITRHLFLAGCIFLVFLCRGAVAEQFESSSLSANMLDLPRDILFDTRDLSLENEDFELESRQTQANATSTSAAAASSTSAGLATASATGLAKMPSPFDQSIGSNFTSSTCPQFFQSFLNNPQFQQCLPLSLLLQVRDPRQGAAFSSHSTDHMQTSIGFFNAQRNIVDLTQVLQTTCSAPLSTCSSLMSSLAKQIQQSSNCGADLKNQNPLVIQAYNGFVAYAPIYHAGCLLDSGGEYCFADLATNASSYQSTYVYYLPLGIQLPGGTQPQCSTCLKQTMAIFAQAASNRSQPLSLTYNNAAQQVNIYCGPSFVQTAIASSPAVPTFAFSNSVLGIFAISAIMFNLFV